tara:strand:- start:471 stop:1208 length:738 start_codon:yes stop_codon:yes gene_type:complete
MNDEYWKKTEQEIVIDSTKETRETSKNNSDYDYVNTELTNINYNYNNPDTMATAEHNVFPTHLKNNWDYPSDNFYEEPFFTSEECDDIVSKWDDKDLSDMSQKLSYRVCDIKWISQFQPGWEWIFERLETKLKIINDNLFKFNFSNPICLESLQFTKYEPGGHYRPHLDWKGRSIHSTRKLSFSINLTNPEKYKSGGLKIYPNSFPSKDKGNIIVFPSFLKHEAIEVKDGTRYAIIGWANGDAFK